MRIHGDEDYPELDLRVDDHAEPLVELSASTTMSLERFQPFVSCLAGARTTPSGIIDRAEIEAGSRASTRTRMARPA